MTPIAAAEVANAAPNRVCLEAARVGAATVWFARDRASLLAARMSVPDVVRETLLSWEDDGRPFWVEFDPTRPWRKPRHAERLADGRVPDLRPSPDLYGFEPPVSFAAPKWWLAELRAWRKRTQR